MQDFGANKDFFQNFNYCHFFSQSYTVSYDHTRFQNFKGHGSPRTQNTRYIWDIEANLTPMNKNIGIK